MHSVGEGVMEWDEFVILKNLFQIGVYLHGICEDPVSLINSHQADKEPQTVQWFGLEPFLDIVKPICKKVVVERNFVVAESKDLNQIGEGLVGIIENSRCEWFDKDGEK
ncbi:hypothetical protein JOB18_006601 [Solea senegalensis]|uniref:Uncharacterized protein n=1 Tax=Solea senegalensis TaxID=28829 RepID=A0AAV6S2L3_SOLSE|nr:hypothetical protein JOB18_006601 [Solea senegalensis]